MIFLGLIFWPQGIFFRSVKNTGIFWVAKRTRGLFLACKKITKRFFGYAKKSGDFLLRLKVPS